MKVYILLVLVFVKYICFPRTKMDLPTNLIVMDSVFKYRKSIQK